MSGAVDPTCIHTIFMFLFTDALFTNNSEAAIIAAILVQNYWTFYMHGRLFKPI